MAKKSVDYGPKHFKTFNAAWRAYEKARLLQTTNPTLPPKDKFAQIWGWGKNR